MGAVLAGRLARFHVTVREPGWLISALLGVAGTTYLAWGGWVSAHDPKWLSADRVWWRVALRPASDGTLLAAITVWVVALICYWWPRKRAPVAVGLTTVVAMVLIGGVLGTSALLPCRSGETRTAVVAWVLGLYVGNPLAAYQAPVCPGQAPLALQLGQIICLAATLIGALAVAAVLWREPLGRFKARFVRDAIVFTGLDAMTMPLLRKLAETGRPASIQPRPPRPPWSSPASWLRARCTRQAGWRGCTRPSLCSC